MVGYEVCPASGAFWKQQEHKYCPHTVVPQSSSFFSVQSSYRTDETGIVPGVTQSLDELITSFNREVTAVTFGAEQSNVIWK